MEEQTAVSSNESEKKTFGEENMDTAQESSDTSKSQAETKTTGDEPEARWSRLKLFEKVMQKSLEKFIEHASLNRFTSTFRPLYKKNPQRMENIYNQFIQELRGAIQEDISRLIEEGRLETKLSELDKLESAAKNNTDSAWRPSGVPEQDLCSFLMPYYLKQETYLRLELKKIQAENAALAQKVLAGRESISLTEHRISAAVEDWKASVTSFDQVASGLCPSDAFDV